MSHSYKDLPYEEQQLLLSNFLINSWSYSKVMTYARHQLAFEMQYIFGLYSRSGISTIAGKAYHKALEVYFTQLKDGLVLPLPELEAVAYQFIEQFPGNQVKLGKTTPTMEEAVAEVLKISTKLIRNFYSEKSEYEDDIAEILSVEEFFDEWLTVNGVDIPLPCRGVIDMRVRTRRNTIAIIDHKSKTTYTDPKAREMVIGPQAIIYALAVEAKHGTPVDEVWFMENKPSENKDKTVQIKPIRQTLDVNTRRLFESILYGNLRQMISAVKDPDHVYTFNPSDNLTDMAELSDFYYRTLMTDVEGFNVEGSKKDLVAKRLKKIRDSNIQAIPVSVIKAFKDKAASFINYDLSATNMTPSEKIVHVLRSFGIMVEVAHFFSGYSSNTFLLNIGAGVKVDSIRKYRMDIANGLDVEAVRIGKSLKVHDGKAYLTVEVAKEKDATLMYAPEDRKGFKIPLGRDNYNNIVIWDLDNQATPHMLVGGTTGSGKSVFIKSTLHYAIEAGVEEIIVLDPKHEFVDMQGAGIDVITDIREIEEALEKCVKEMNRRIAAKQNSKTLIIFDEYADAIGRARKGPELKAYKQVQDGFYANGNAKYKREHTGDITSLSENAAMLLQKGRSSGFRLLFAAQRPSTEIIPGDAKANFPVRVAFRLAKQVDSEVVLDEPGAESLTSNGDGLIISPEYRETVRFQSYYKPQNVTA